VSAYAFAASPCGGLAMAVNGTGVTMRCSGAAWLEDARALIVADLHFEKGSSYAARGQMLPPYDTRETLRSLEAEVAATNPALLVFLGDSFHDGEAEGRLDADDAGRIAALAKGRTLVWAVGTHDADGPRALPGETADEMTLATLTLRHEPREGVQDGEVAGHLHPAARVAGRTDPATYCTLPRNGSSGYAATVNVTSAPVFTLAKLISGTVNSRRSLPIWAMDTMRDEGCTYSPTLT